MVICRRRLIDEVKNGSPRKIVSVNIPVVKSDGQAWQSMHRSQIAGPSSDVGRPCPKRQSGQTLIANERAIASASQIIPRRTAALRTARSLCCAGRRLPARQLAWSKAQPRPVAHPPPSALTLCGLFGGSWPCSTMFSRDVQAGSPSSVRPGAGPQDATVTFAYE